MEPDFWEQPGAIWRRSEVQGKGEEREETNLRRFDEVQKQDKVFKALTVKLKVYSEKHEEIERDERLLRRSYERKSSSRV